MLELPERIKHAVTPEAEAAACCFLIRRLPVCPERVCVPGLCLVMLQGGVHQPAEQRVWTVGSGF